MKKMVRRKIRNKKLAKPETMIRSFRGGPAYHAGLWIDGKLMCCVWQNEKMEKVLEDLYARGFKDGQNSAKKKEEIMDEKELEKEIEERKKQAEKKRIDVKAMAIARCLGYGPESEDDTDKTFRDSNFTIHYFWKKSYVGTDCELNIDGGLRIQHRTKIVFQSAFSHIYCYIPGDWEKELEKLYLEAKRVAEQKKKESEEEEKKSKDKRIREEKKKWGL